MTRESMIAAVKILRKPLAC